MIKQFNFYIYVCFFFKIWNKNFKKLVPPYSTSFIFFKTKHVNNFIHIKYLKKNKLNIFFKKIVFLHKIKLKDKKKSQPALINKYKINIFKAFLLHKNSIYTKQRSPFKSLLKQQVVLLAIAIAFLNNTFVNFSSDTWLLNTKAKKFLNKRFIRFHYNPINNFWLQMHQLISRSLIVDFLLLWIDTISSSETVEQSIFFKSERFNKEKNSISNLLESYKLQKNKIIPILKTKNQEKDKKKKLNLQKKIQKFLIFKKPQYFLFKFLILKPTLFNWLMKKSNKKNLFVYSQKKNKKTNQLHLLKTYMLRHFFYSLYLLSNNERQVNYLLNKFGRYGFKSFQNSFFFIITILNKKFYEQINEDLEPEDPNYKTIEESFFAPDMYIDTIFNHNRLLNYSKQMSRLWKCFLNIKPYKMNVMFFWKKNWKKTFFEEDQFDPMFTNSHLYLEVENFIEAQKKKDVLLLKTTKMDDIYSFFKKWGIIKNQINRFSDWQLWSFFLLENIFNLNVFKTKVSFLINFKNFNNDFFNLFNFFYNQLLLHSRITQYCVLELSLKFAFMFWTKNANLFLQYLDQVFFNMERKQQNELVFLLQCFQNNVLLFYLKPLKILGFYLRIKGKVAGYPGGRKQVFFSRYGIFSRSNITVRTNFFKKQLITLNGSIGIKLTISYV